MITPIPLPTQVAASAEDTCGVDLHSVALATGHRVDDVSGSLGAFGGTGGGECVMRGATSESPIAVITLDPLDSEAGVLLRAQVDGDGQVPPDVRFGDLDGGVWGDVTVSADRRSLGASSGVVWGRTAIQVTLASGEVGRDPVADLEALTRQVAASFGLGDP